MTPLNVTFNVPAFVAQGIATGELNIFGGVVRSNSGRIVYMLKEAAQFVPRMTKSRIPTGKVAIALIGVAAVAGVGYWAYKRYSKNGRVIAHLESLDAAFLGYAAKAQEQRLSLDEIKRLSLELEAFVQTLERSDSKDTEILVDKESLQKLREFYESVRVFNEDIRQRLGVSCPVPAVAQSEDCRSLLQELREQLKFQEVALNSREQVFNPIPAGS